MLYKAIIKIILKFIFVHRDFNYDDIIHGTKKK